MPQFRPKAAASTRAFRAAAAAMMLAVLATLATSATASPPTAGGVRDFFSRITGEWIGVCKQSTDGEPAPDKYFHVIVSQVDADTFSARFEYYRPDDKTGNLERIGESTVTTDVGPDGAGTARIKGRGSVLVNGKPKNHEHDLTEVLTGSSGSGLQGEGSGRISVHGMPLGLGRNGKIRRDRSNWSLQNGVLTIDQTLTAGFRALIFSRSFTITAQFTATRGSNVASLLGRRVASR